MIRFLLFVALFLLSINIYAQNDDNDSVIMEANKISTIDNDTAVAEGDVLFLYKDMVLVTDKAVYNKKEKWVELEGNIIYQDKSNMLRAEHAKINLDNKSGYFEKGKGFYAPWHYFSADKAEKIGDDSYVMDNASITTCTQEVPDWSFSASKARIDFGEYFKAKDAYGKIKDKTVLYLPYFVWPIKTERESGFLLPQFGFNNSKGAFITPKYFWAMDVDKDMTAGVDLFSKSGVMFLDEFRYSISKEENLHLIGEYIDDQNSDSNKTSRWRLFGVGNVFLTKNLEVRLNVDYASDYRYKKDFKDFNMIDKLPEMDPDKNDFIAELRVNYYTKYADFSVKYRDSMQYYDTSEGYSKDHIYQKPSLQVEKYGLDASIIKIDYLVDFNSVENRLSHYRYDLDDESHTYTYDRFNSKLKIYKPIDLKFATFTPFYSQYYTHWYNFNHNLNSFSDHEQTFLDVDVNSDSATRKIYSFGGSLNINEIYKDYKYFRHSLYNTFEYIQTPYAEQSGLPDYIENDKISESKIYSYTMTNYLKGENFSLKLQLIQGYDMTLPKNRFTPFHEKLTVKYLDIFGFYLESKYNYYSDKIEYYKNDFSIDLSNYYINFSQSFDRTIQDTDNAIMGIKVGARFTKWDFEVYKQIGKRINDFSYDPTNLSGREFHTKILYKSECWSLGFLYKEDSYDELKTTGYDNNKNRTFLVLIELRGIGATQKEIYKL